MQNDLTKTNEQLLREAREYVASVRAKQEFQVAAWGESIKKVRQTNPELLEGIDLPEDITLKAVIPEIYKEDPDEKVYKEQLANFKEKVDKVNAIAIQVNERARKCLLEHQQLISSRV